MLQVNIMYLMKEFFSFQLFISQSYDATSHFQSTCKNVLEIYKNVTGSDFDFSKVQGDLAQNQE